MDSSQTSEEMKREWEGEGEGEGTQFWHGNELGLYLGVEDTIYEEDREESTHRSSPLSPADIVSNSGARCSLAIAGDRDRESTWIPFQSSPHSFAIQQLLQRSVRSWCEATGFPANVFVQVRDWTFKLHKFPLVSRSGFLKRQLMEGNEVDLGDTFPGGPPNFQVVAAYCYGCTIVMDPSNIAAIRCGSEFLEMTEEYCRGNLCKRSEHYFNGVILQSWKDSIEVLRNCENLHPLAEEMLIVNRCIEAISIMAVMYSCEKKCELKEGDSVDSRQDWWINELLKLPFEYFGQFIACVRRRGMQEKIIGRTMLFYVDRWIFDMLRTKENSVNLCKISQDAQEVEAFSGAEERRGVIETLVKLLPREKDVMPVSFLFAILRCALAWDASLECRIHLQKRIASQLEQATVTDFLLPLKTEENQVMASSTEIESMQQIVSHFVSEHRNAGDYPSGSPFTDGTKITSVDPCVSAVAKIWDEYLVEMALDPRLPPLAFLNLIHTVPSSSRLSHDLLYKAIHVYLKRHPEMSEQQKDSICKTLECQKLSKEVCVHLVQNHLVPLRLVVQAVFLHQLQALSDSEENGNNISRANKNGHAHALTLDASANELNSCRNEKGITSLGCILKRDEANHLKVDFDETWSRLRSLEEEIALMRTSFQASFRNANHHMGDEAPMAFKQLDVVKDIAEIAEKNFSRVKRPPPRLANKGCGNGVTRNFVKSLQKLSLKKKQTN